MMFIMSEAFPTPLCSLYYKCIHHYIVGLNNLTAQTIVDFYL